MINFDITKESIKEDSPNWPWIPYHPYRILTIGGSESEKTNLSFNLISDQPDINKTYMLKIHMIKNFNCLLTKK